MRTEELRIKEIKSKNSRSESDPPSPNTHQLGDGRGDDGGFDNSITV